MKLTNKTITKSAQSLANIGSVKMASALKFRLARVIKQVQDAIEDLDKVKTELFKREGTLNKEKSQYDWNSDAAEERVEQELKDLYDVEVDIKFDKFSEESFEKLDTSSLDHANCLWLFGESDSNEPSNDSE